MQSIDSLILEKNLRKNVTSYYIRPLFEVQQFSTRLQGDPQFTEPRAGLIRNKGIGIRLGYRSETIEIETGLSSIWVGSGFQYKSEFDDIFYPISHLRSRGYTHIPLIFRYRIWQPTRRLSIRAGVGVAFNKDFNKFPMAPTINEVESVSSGNGMFTDVAQMRKTFLARRSFWSGDVNVSAFYRLSRRFGATVEARRLISAGRIATFDIVRRVFEPARVQQFNGVSSANGFVVNVGLSFQLGFRNYYRFNDE